jgi:tetratricopeptide (TPR) repeat protein
MSNAANNTGALSPGKTIAAETLEYNPPPSLLLQIFLFCAFLVTVGAYVAGERSDRVAEQVVAKVRDVKLDRKSKFLAYTRHGFQAEEQKHFDTAVSNFQCAVLLQDSVEAHTNLGNALLLDSRTNEALREFQAALALTPRPKMPAPASAAVRP